MKGMKMRRVISMFAVFLLFMGGTPDARAVETNKVDGTEVVRLSGDTRYDTAGEIASEYANVAGNPVNTVILASGTGYADALASVPMAAKLNSPILLTSGSGKIEKTVLAKIKEIGATKVIIVGGTGVISSECEESLAANGLTVERVYGATRYETAVEIAKYSASAGNHPIRETAAELAEYSASANDHPTSGITAEFAEYSTSANDHPTSGTTTEIAEYSASANDLAIPETAAEIAEYSASANDLAIPETAAEIAEYSASANDLAIPETAAEIAEYSVSASDLSISETAVELAEYSASASDLAIPETAAENTEYSASANGLPTSETATENTEYSTSESDLPKYETIYIASGENFPDTLSVAPIAAINNSAILFSPANGNIPDSVIEFIKANNIKSAVIAGGTGAVSEKAETVLKNSCNITDINRLSGQTRYDTAAAIYDEYKSIFDKNIITAATGDNFPDALSGGVLAAKINAPVILLQNNGMNAVFAPIVSKLPLEKAYVFGGTGVVSDNTVGNVIKGIIPPPTTTTTTAPTKPTVPEMSAADKKKIQNAVNQSGSKYGADGIQVAVITNGVVTDTYNYGWATKKSDKMTSDNIFRVASISKVAVGVCALKMQEQGIVDLDAKIGNYWGAKLPRNVTLRHLLTHTSTLSDLSYSSSKSGTLSQLRSSGNYTGGTLGSKGVWRYNNYAMGVAGSTLEVASGQMLNDYAKKHIFEPLGMDAAFASGLVKNKAALGTIYYADGSVGRTTYTSKNYTGRSIPGANTAMFAGGLTCSAEDLAKLFAMLANDGTYNGVRVLKPESVAAMEKRMFTTSEHGGSFMQAMPLRYKKNLYGESEIYYHTGNAYGLLSLACYNPATKSGVVVVTTGASAARDSQGVYAVCSDIVNQVFKFV